jgi:methanogenic corrinoid protein MtbC1
MLTLPGEEHGLGLQMAALLMVLSGVRVQLLGREVPLPDIRRAVDESGAAAVAISVSLATGGVRTDRALAALRAELPARVRIVVGGEGARGVRRGPRSLEYAQTPREIARWAARLKSGSEAEQRAPERSAS